MTQEQLVKNGDSATPFPGEKPVSAQNIESELRCTLLAKYPYVGAIVKKLHVEKYPLSYVVKITLPKTAHLDTIELLKNLIGENMYIYADGRNIRVDIYVGGGLLCHGT